MKKLENYERAELEVVFIKENDVIATSTPTGSDNIGNVECLYEKTVGQKFFLRHRFTN